MILKIPLRGEAIPRDSGIWNSIKGFDPCKNPFRLVIITGSQGSGKTTYILKGFYRSSLEYKIYDLRKNKKIDFEEKDYLIFLNMHYAPEKTFLQVIENIPNLEGKIIFELDNPTLEKLIELAREGKVKNNELKNLGISYKNGNIVFSSYVSLTSDILVIPIIPNVNIFRLVRFIEKCFNVSLEENFFKNYFNYLRMLSERIEYLRNLGQKRKVERIMDFVRHYVCSYDIRKLQNIQKRYIAYRNALLEASKKEILLRFEAEKLKMLKKYFENLFPPYSSFRLGFFFIKFILEGKYYNAYTKTSFLDLFKKEKINDSGYLTISLS